MAAEPWLSMRNARIITQATDTDNCSMGWSAGNGALNLLTRLSTRNDKRWIDFDDLVHPHSQAVTPKRGGFPPEVFNTVFRLNLMSSVTKLSTSHPIFTTHHPKSISDSDHGVDSAESCALELCVQVASTQCHFAGRPATLDVYANYDDVHRSLPAGSSYPHLPVLQPDGANPIYCGDIETNLGCFHPVVVPPRCRESVIRRKTDMYKNQTTAAGLSTEQDKKRLKYQQFWYMHDFKDAGTALYDRNRVVRFPPVCKCDLCPCCEKTYNHPFQPSHRFSPCPGQLPPPGVFPRVPVAGSCDCNCTNDPPPPLGQFPVPPCSVYEKLYYRFWNPQLTATWYINTIPCPAGYIPYYLQ